MAEMYVCWECGGDRHFRCEFCGEPVVYSKRYGRRMDAHGPSPHWCDATARITPAPMPETYVAEAPPAPPKPAPKAPERAPEKKPAAPRRYGAVM